MCILFLYVIPADKYDKLSDIIGYYRIYIYVLPPPNQEKGNAVRLTSSSSIITPP